MLIEETRTEVVRRGASPDDRKLTRGKLVPARLTALVVLLGAFFPMANRSLAAPVDVDSLGRAIPSDVFFFVESRANPEREFLEKHYADLFNAVVDCGIFEAVTDIVVSNLPDGAESEMTGVMDTVKRFGKMVDWENLVAYETAFAMQMSFPTPVYIVVINPKPEEYEAALTGLKNILAEVQKFESTFTLETVTRDNADMTALSFGANLPVELCIAGIDGKIILTTRAEVIRNSIDLYNGKTKGSILEHAWYQEGIGRLPAYEDAQSFFNLDSLLDGYVDMLNSVVSSNDGGEEAEQIIGIVKEAVDQFRIIQYIVGIQTTEENRTVNESFTKFSPEASSMPLFKAAFDQATFNDYHKYVPKGVTSFSLNSGLNPNALYSMITSFVKNKVPDGEALLQRWDGMQAEWGINIAEDVLSWLSGETISFSQPAGGGAGMGMGMGMGGDSVTLIKVNDAEKGKKAVEAGLKAVSELAKTIGQTLLITPAPSAGEGFHSIMFPMMPIIKPVVGFDGDYLVIATSGAAIDAMRKVRAGEAPSVLENPKFASLGLKPDGPVCAISFTDMSATYQEMSQMMAMVPMFAAMGLQGNDPKMKIARDCVNVLPLLAPVIQKMDFHLSTSGFTTKTKDGCYTKTVNSFRKSDDA